MNADALKFAGNVLLQAPIFVNWNYTYRCPLNCAHCYSRERSVENELSEEKKLLVAQNIIRNQVFYVSFGGGECLADPFLPQIIRKLSQSGVFTSLSTNGWHISASTLRGLKDAGLDRLVVSLDSPDAAVHDARRRTPGCFQEVMRVLSMCAAIHLPTMLSTVIARDNVRQLEELFAIAEQYRCVGVDLKRLKLTGNAQTLQNWTLTEEEERALFQNMKRWKETYPLELNLSYRFQPLEGIDDGCACGKRLLTVLHNGDLSACAYRPKILGNAVSDDIGVVWRESAILRQMREATCCAGDEF